jgi:hypothetical protein
MSRPLRSEHAAHIGLRTGYRPTYRPVLAWVHPKPRVARAAYYHEEELLLALLIFNVILWTW